MKSIELLRAEAARKRVYRTSSNIFDKIDSLAALFQQRHPETDWSDYRARLSTDDPITGNYDFAARHMIKWGKAEARIIEDAFQISLPPGVHELYSHMQEALLVWRNIFYLPPPDEVVEWERQNREWEDRDPDERPIRLVRFIRCERASGDIALRRSVRDEQWRIFYESVDNDATREDPSVDKFALADNLDTWLQYVIENDGAFSCEEQHQKQAAYLIERIG